ncbi:spore coat protein YsxE [Oceanobacillus limi]|uniref:Spore coat protein YsxE n=1 Tax=Oceanobacillus limi TaxID=930131 RepID=A0A1I0GFN8_9BACI|nr:phosphotransferase [Oceanobacillus limi]SET69895.1 spore coat protein YsxE [Oceanobacillus limi]
MEQIRAVLQEYGITSVEIEPITDRLYRVIDPYHNQYALKKSTLTEKSVMNWKHVLHTANSNNLVNVSPVYLTKQGELYYERNNEIFYLTPWLLAKSEPKNLGKIFQAIGFIHRTTKKTQSFSPESTTTSFKEYKKHCDSARLSLLSYVEQFEQRRYMSPFELLVCTQFHVLNNVFRELIRKLDQLISNLDEDDGVWSTSLCHGNLRMDHIIESNQLLFINWENASYHNAIQDLVSFFKNNVIYYDSPTDDLLNNFANYMNENSLESSEIYLLTIYLLDPTYYMDLIRTYYDGNDTSMIDQIKKLQQTYRQLIFALKFSQHVETEYESLSLEDLES